MEKFVDPLHILVIRSPLHIFCSSEYIFFFHSAPIGMSNGIALSQTCTPVGVIFPGMGGSCTGVW